MVGAGSFARRGRASTFHRPAFALLLLLLSALEPAEPLTIPLGLDRYMPVPEENPITAAKIALGRRLFHDKRLSRDKTLACSSCHDPARAFTDGRRVSVGVFGRRGARNVPTIVNRGYGRAFFWDGRISSLEEQVIQPILNHLEMDMTLEEASARVELTQGEIAHALASYVRSILSGDSPYDRFVFGDRDALTAEERHGLEIFRGKGNCTACHAGPILTDESFHNTGVAWRDGELLDEGRYSVTRNNEDRGAFKTPTLREVARTAPYMHDGSFATLEDVVELYDKGGIANPHLDPELRPLRLTAEEKAAVVAFLYTLSGRVQEGLTGAEPATAPADVVERPGALPARAWRVQVAEYRRGGRNGLRLRSR